jgi:hypothetical protein
MSNDDVTYFSEEDDRNLEESFVSAFNSSYPNPSRKGCPDPKLIRDLVFKRIKDKAKLSEIMEHCVKCSPCSREARIFLIMSEEMQQNPKGETKK